MVTSLPVNYYAKGMQKECHCEVLLRAPLSKRFIEFTCVDFSFSIVLKDIVDVEELCRLMRKDIVKAQLYCVLKKQDREYQGIKKFVWRNGNLQVSAGGARLELEQECLMKLIQSLNALRQI